MSTTNPQDFVRKARRKLGSLLPGRPPAGRSRGRVVRPWRDDAYRSHPSLGLTPQRVLAFLHAADAGAPQMQFELFDEMLQKWPRLAAVEATRRLALTGLDWEITAEAQCTADRTVARLAGQAADFCRETLGEIESFGDVLIHQASAIGYGVAVTELVWEDGRLVDLTPVPHSRLAADPREPWRLRVRTEESPALGVPLDEAPRKWIVHRPRPTPGRYFEGGLLRASALLYVAQSLSFKDWLIYSQIAGMPMRLGRFEPNMPEEDKRRLLGMLASLGTDAAAVVSKDVEVELLEARTGEKPYQPLQEYCNNEATILWLGLHLTTDIKGQGSRAAAEIHDRVREDLLVDDISDESRTIRRDLLTPLVRARFGDAAPAPCFRRSLIQSVDTKVLAETLAVAVRDLGMRVPRRWVHRALGIPEPAKDEAVLTPEGIK